MHHTISTYLNVISIRNVWSGRCKFVNYIKNVKNIYIGELWNIFYLHLNIT